MSNYKRNFKSTQIPYRAKNGDPMQYVILTEEGTEIATTRAECLAPTETSDNPYPQRWFVDEESGLVLRLPRTSESEVLARENMRYIWRESKREERWTERIITPTITEDGDVIEFEVPDTCDIAAIFEDAELLATLHKALATILTPEEQDLIKEIFWHGKSEREIAAQMDFKQNKSVNNRKHKILEKLRNHEGLKSFFK